MSLLNFASSLGRLLPLLSRLFAIFLPDFLLLLSRLFAVSLPLCRCNSTTPPATTPPATTPPATAAPFCLAGVPEACSFTTRPPPSCPALSPLPRLPSSCGCMGALNGYGSTLSGPLGFAVEMATGGVTEGESMPLRGLQLISFGSGQEFEGQTGPHTFDIFALPFSCRFRGLATLLFLILFVMTCEPN